MRTVQDARFRDPADNKQPDLGRLQFNNFLMSEHVFLLFI